MGRFVLHQGWILTKRCYKCHDSGPLRIEENDCNPQCKKIWIGGNNVCNQTCWRLFQSKCLYYKRKIEYFSCQIVLAPPSWIIMAYYGCLFFLTQITIIQDDYAREISKWKEAILKCGCLKNDEGWSIQSATSFSVIHLCVCKDFFLSWTYRNVSFLYFQVSIFPMTFTCSFCFFINFSCGCC